MAIAWPRYLPSEQMARVRQVLLPAIVIETFSNFAVYALILGSYYAFDYYRKYRQREMRSLELDGRLAQAELPPAL
jgi:hypothetical protein